MKSVLSKADISRWIFYMLMWSALCVISKALSFLTVRDGAD